MNRPRALPYIALYPTDFLAATGHLGNTELGIYWRLLLVYYRDARPLPADLDRLRRLALAFSPEESRALEQVVSEFFVPGAEPDGTRVYRHRRADLEIERAQASHAAQCHRTEAARAARQAIRDAQKNVAKSVTDNVTSSLHHPNQNQNQNQSKDKSNTLVDAAGADLLTADVSTATEPARAAKPPACPFDAIVALYRETLPTNPDVVALSERRKSHIRARWLQVWEDERFDHSGGLAFFRAYFEKVARSKFLTGKTKTVDGRAPFRASLDWLANAENFLKVLEGRYE